MLMVLCGALFLDALDVSMMGIALPAMQSPLHMDTASLQWLVSSYVIGFGAVLLVGGRAADQFGRRRMLLAGLAVFGICSLISGLLDNGSLIIVVRFIKGMAAAFTAPAGLSLLTTTFPEGPMRNKAISVYTAFGASGFSLGLVFSGLLTEISWRWALLFPAPVTLLVLIGGIALVPRQQSGAGERRRLDVPGAVLVTAAMVLLVYTVTSAQAAGWASARTISLFAAVVVLLAAFVLRELRTSDPLLRFGIFRSGTLTRASLGGIVLSGTYWSFQFMLTLYLQSANGWSAISTALAFLPGGVIVAILSFRIGNIINRLGPGRTTLIAFVCLIAAYAGFLRIGPTPDFTGVILPAMLLIGIAFGLSFSALNVAATAGVDPAEQGLAAGIFQTSFQVGGAVVLAVVTAVVTAGGATVSASPAATVDAYRPALVLITVIAALGIALAADGLRRPRLSSQPA
ncbi:MAG TPA: MFS transporter [Pseudonocardiaceae bacterium]|nr:MFS transporter [Pseudonocardiaceae bacterium]